MKEKILVSACLLGEPCRYDGKSKPQAHIMTQYAEEHLLPICPEVMGGLPTPRVPAELQGDRVMTQAGTDVTAAFESGANQVLALAQEHGIRQAILKAKSPSCGCGQVYDGTFSGRLKEGDGLLTQKLKAAGIHVKTEEDA